MGSGASAPKAPADALAAAKELLGEKLVKFAGEGKTEEVSVEDALKDKKAVALYFSAHWCPPCRGFTPKLAEAYKNHLKDKGLEVIFISSDRSEEHFMEYLGEMPWLALPFEDRSKKGMISSKFKVSGIPMLIILDPNDGTVITEDGRMACSRDPTGEKFPWKPRSFKEVLSGGLMKGNETVGAETIEGKHIGLYFSAHWCGPCRQFTPELAKWYAAVKKEMCDKFEIVFCSGDRDAESLKGYYEEQKSKGGDWLALPFEKKDDLDGLFKVSGIPTFLIVDPDGNVVCKGGRALVNQHLSMPAIPFSDFPWAPSALQELDDPGEQDINDKPTMCLMLESVPIANQSEIMEKVKPIAEKWAKTGEIQFLVARQNNSASATIRAVCGLETVEKVSKTDRSEVSSARGAPKVVRSMSVDTPWLIILDCPEGGAYYFGKMAKEMDGSGMEAMLEGWKNKTLERKQLK